MYTSQGEEKSLPVPILVYQTIIPCFSCLLTPNIKDQTIDEAEDRGANKAKNKGICLHLLIKAIH